MIGVRNVLMWVQIYVYIYVVLVRRQGGDLSAARYEECMEKFFSICDQMELHLVRAIAAWLVMTAG